MLEDLERILSPLRLYCYSNYCYMYLAANPRPDVPSQVMALAGTEAQIVTVVFTYMLLVPFSPQHQPSIPAYYKEKTGCKLVIKKYYNQAM